jgi:hypothetical protein
VGGLSLFLPLKPKHPRDRIHAIEIHACHIRRPKAQIHQAQHDCPIAQANGGGTNGTHQAFQIIAADSFWQGCQPPVGKGRDGSSQITINESVKQKETKEGPDGRGDHLATGRTTKPSLVRYKPPDTIGRPLPQLSKASNTKAQEHSAGVTQPIMHCDRSKPLDLIQVIGVPPQERFQK